MTNSTHEHRNPHRNTQSRTDTTRVGPEENDHHQGKVGKTRDKGRRQRKESQTWRSPHDRRDSPRENGENREVGPQGEVPVHPAGWTSYRLQARHTQPRQAPIPLPPTFLKTSLRECAEYARSCVGVYSPWQVPTLRGQCNRYGSVTVRTHTFLC